MRSIENWTTLLRVRDCAGPHCLGVLVIRQSQSKLVCESMSVIAISRRLLGISFAVM